MLLVGGLRNEDSPRIFLLLNERGKARLPSLAFVLQHRLSGVVYLLPVWSAPAVLFNVTVSEGCGVGCLGDCCVCWGLGAADCAASLDWAVYALLTGFTMICISAWARRTLAYRGFSAEIGVGKTRLLKAKLKTASAPVVAR
jgi:hypothetical protein